MSPKVRNAVVDHVTELQELTKLPVACILAWTGLQKGRFYDWRKRYGDINRHNGRVPRDHWLTAAERHAILEFHDRHPLNGYRRLAYMMLDADVVAASPSTIYRALRDAGRLDRWSPPPSRKGTGFTQPSGPHRHWHIDIAYLNIAGTFYYLCSILDGFSRFIVHWSIHEQMKEADVELIVQQALEKYPGANVRLISDNGPQFIARDFRHFIRLVGMTHVLTSPYYPQSNGKIERWHRTLKHTTIRPKTPESLEEARDFVGGFVEDYNHQRLHSAIGYVTPADKLAGRAEIIHADRARKLDEARVRRAEVRQAAREAA
ncbi:MAG: IS3 family transposase [Myxococcales bacterium]|nr:IS3 family transposase [Myxococcales bacterium]